MATRDPGWGMTPQQVEDFYHRWREWMLVASTHGATVVANIRHKGFFRDLVERLQEDNWWRLQKGDDPVMMFSPAVPYDDLYFHVVGRGLLKPADLLGNTGFGRLNAKAPSRDGVSPWRVPDGVVDTKPVTPDGHDSPATDA